MGRTTLRQKRPIVTRNPATQRYRRFVFSLQFHRRRRNMAAAIAPSGETQWDFMCDFEVDFESEVHASIVYAALAVDKELQPDKVKRLMSVRNSKLVVHFEAVEARFLRASFSAFVDVLNLAARTVEEFGQ